MLNSSLNHSVARFIAYDAYLHYVLTRQVTRVNGLHLSRLIRLLTLTILLLRFFTTNNNQFKILYCTSILVLPCTGTRVLNKFNGHGFAKCSGPGKLKVDQTKNQCRG
ncbi:uncharacterized protein LOC143618918 [Bidens hawaiensis]|uniref:uncharacterized protein LOC143618918 n=1 Tax=Bidens hawaiensis TaxID=980011 RepID=UPI00404A8581